MALADQGLTADEFLELPLDEYRFTQLIDGEIVVTEASLRHQRIVMFLARRLAEWTEEGPGRGEAGIAVDVVLDERNVFAPGLWWVTEARRPGEGARSLEGPPDLAVEVSSPSTWRHDTEVKKDTYERAGLPELWLVDTEAEVVLVHRRSSPEAPVFDVHLTLVTEHELGSPQLPDFGLSVRELFAR
jgi:Uma2 family endonuclease